MADIQIKNLSKAFDGQPILDGLSVCFPAGQISCIMGSSGQGKTTLLQCLLGFCQPDSGSITGLADRRIAVIFQENRLAESLSVQSNLRLVCGKSVTVAAMEQHLAAVGLTGTLHQTVATLSGGMKRRLAIVRALLYDAEIVIMDEPLSGLDVETKAKVVAYMRQQLAGKLAIVVTHEVQDIAALGGVLTLEM